MAAGNSSFNLQGATPQQSVNNIASNSSIGSSPYSKALTSAFSGANIFPNPTPPPVVAPAAPVNQDVKNHTVTHPDGTVVSQTYHPTTAGLINTPAPKAQASYTNGQALPAVGTPEYTAAQNLARGTATQPLNNTPTPTPVAPTTFPGLINSLATQNTSPYNTIATDAAKRLADADIQNKIYADRAKAIADTAGTAISNVGQEGARAEAGYRTTGTSPVGEGNAAVLGQTTAAQQAAIAQGANVELAGNAQGLTAQQQAQAGLLGAGTTALTGQGTAQSALGTAAGLAAPQLGQYGQPFYNPLTAGTETGGGGSLNPINNISSIAQQVLSGKISPSQGYALGGSVANFQGALNAEIIKQNPNANLANLQGQFDANQSNTTLAGTATQTANNDVYQKAFGDYQNLNQTVQNVDQFGNLLIQNMAGINPLDLKGGNILLKDAKNLLSSPQQAAFDTTFAQLRAQIATLLSTGGAQIPTQTTVDANNILSGNVPVGTLQATLNRIQQEGNILLTTQAGKVNSAKAGLSGQAAPQVTGLNQTAQSILDKYGIK